MDIFSVAFAVIGLQLSIGGGIWQLRGQLSKEAGLIRESINKIELAQVGDREKNDGRYQLLSAAVEGSMERADHRFLLLDQRLKAVERKLDGL